MRPASAASVTCGVLLDRPVEMRGRDERAEIVVAALVLRVERQPVDQRRRAVRRVGPRDAEQRAMIGCTPVFFAASEKAIAP